MLGSALGARLTLGCAASTPLGAADTDGSDELDGALETDGSVLGARETEGTSNSVGD